MSNYDYVAYRNEENRLWEREKERDAKITKKTPQPVFLWCLLIAMLIGTISLL